MDTINILIDVIQALILAVFSYSFIKKKYSKYNLIAVYLLFIILSIEILYFDYNTTFEAFYSLAYSLTIFIVLRPIALEKNVELLTLSFILNLLISVGNGVALIIMTFVLNITMEEIVNSLCILAVGGIISTISICFIGMIIMRIKDSIVNMMAPYSKHFLAIIVLLYTTITLLEKILFSQVYNENVVLLSWVCILCLFCMVIVLMVKIAKDNLVKVNQSALSKEIEGIKDRFSKLEEHNAKISTIKHDMNKTFAILRNYLTSDDDGKALEVLNKLLKDSNTSPNLMVTGKGLIDTIISSKAIDCASAGIEFFSQIDLSNVANYDEFDFSLLLLNLISNAVENIDPNEKVIKLIISNMGSVTFIKVSNSVQREVLRDNPRMETTKQNKELHGFGIQSMKNIAKKYDGNILFSQEGNEFTCKVILYNATK